jgi:hypothetical protein
VVDYAGIAATNSEFDVEQRQVVVQAQAQYPTLDESRSVAGTGHN